MQHLVSSCITVTNNVENSCSVKHLYTVLFTKDEGWCKYINNVLINQKFCSFFNNYYAVASLSNAIHINERPYKLQDYYSVEDKTLALVSFLRLFTSYLYYKGHRIYTYHLIIFQFLD